MRTSLITLFAARAAAEITTSFWMPDGNIFGTNRTLTYIASVVGAEEGRTTVAAYLSDAPGYWDVDEKKANPQTFTVGPKMYEFSLADTESSGSWAASMHCEKQNTDDASATCKGSQGPGVFVAGCTATGSRPPPETVTGHWTFSEKTTQGVETIVQTFFPSREPRPIPDWCSAGSDGQISVPQSVMELDEVVPTSRFKTYGLVITAGEEKLPGATMGGTLSTATVQPTGDQATESKPSEATGAAAPMRTLAPALAGLGAAVAVFL